jgi:hypothetical protein
MPLRLTGREFVCLAFMRFHISPRMTPNVNITTQPRTASSISLAGIGAARRNKEGGLAIAGTAAKASHRRRAFELMVLNRPCDLLEVGPGVLAGC